MHATVDAPSPVELVTFEVATSPFAPMAIVTTALPVCVGSMASPLLAQPRRRGRIIATTRSSPLAAPVTVVEITATGPPMSTVAPHDGFVRPTPQAACPIRPMLPVPMLPIPIPVPTGAALADAVADADATTSVLAVSEGAVATDAEAEAVTLGTSRATAGPSLESFLHASSEVPSTAAIVASHASRESLTLQKTYPMLAPKSQSRRCTCTPLLSVSA